MAQLVEHNLAKVGVAGSSPVVRSIAFPDRLDGPFSAKWPSGKAEACKAFTPGSNPGFASRQHPGAPAPVLFYICGHGSVGRAPPCQGGGRGFEPRCPLQKSYSRGNCPGCFRFRARIGARTDEVEFRQENRPVGGF